MNRLRFTDRVQVIRSLCEGNSLRRSSQLCGCAINTVVKSLMEVGTACSVYQDEHLRGLNSHVVQCDRIWTFVGRSDKPAKQAKMAMGKDDAWTWMAIDANSRLMINWLVGLRSEWDCCEFLGDLESRLTHRIELSKDGVRPRRGAVKLAFGENVDPSIVEKVFRKGSPAEKQYSPAPCTSSMTVAVIRDSIDDNISTRDANRRNLNFRMGRSCHSHLTNAFYKKLEKHIAAFSLFAMYYNFCRPHQTLTQEAKKKWYRNAKTPAMATGLTDRIWAVSELIRAVAESK
ncbi:MAG: IS1 family transposase [Armatimonadetes bacterium]|nr:IS1 family transposase [Armatimonadota bacterium]